MSEFGPHPAQLLSLDDAGQWLQAVAAANWHALATYSCRFTPADSALLIDIGSTTTDVIPLVAGTPVPLGLTDFGRLRSTELVYTGVRRTPVCAILGSEVAAEFFATAHDVYLRLDMATEDPTDCSTADGRPATVEGAHARLSRMLGADAEDTEEDETYDLAQRAFERQRDVIAAAIRNVSSRLADPPQTILVSGSGEFLARAAIDVVFGGASPHIRSMASQLGDAVSHAACAFALAVLVSEAQA